MHIIKSFIFLACVSLFCCPIHEVAAQEQDNSPVDNRVNVPGTNVSIRISDVFIYDAGQSAFIYAGAAASLSVVEMPQTPYKSAVSQFDAKSIGGQGMTLISEENVLTASGSVGKLFTVSMVLPSSEAGKSVEYRRMIMVSGDATRSVCLIANYPLVTEKVLSEPVRSAFLSIEYQPAD